MADDKTPSFSHIKVGGSFDDQDDVIVAGIKDCDQGVAAQSEEQVQVAKDFEPVSEAPVAELHENSVKDVAESVSADEEPESVAASMAAEATSSTKTKSKAKSKGDFQETTLEDLDSVKMGTTQKIVIAIAIVLLIVGIYCVINPPVAQALGIDGSSTETVEVAADVNMANEA